MKIMGNAMGNKLPDVFFQFQVRLATSAAVMFFYVVAAVEAIMFFSVFSGRHLETILII